MTDREQRALDAAVVRRFKRGDRIPTIAAAYCEHMTRSPCTRCMNAVEAAIRRALRDAGDGVDT